MSGAIVAAGIGAAGALGGAALSSHAAGKAASTQASAADRASQLNYEASQNALNYQKQKDTQQRQDFAPWLEGGKAGLSQLEYLMGLGPQSGGNPAGGAYGSLLQPYGQQFTAPTGLTMQNDPGYQARLKLGTDAIQRSAAARGGLLTGGTAQALNQYGQDYASNEYGQVYNRALTGFQTNYNAHNNDQANTFNRLAGVSGEGQQTAAQLGQLGQQSANSVSSNLLGTAGQMGQAQQNAAAANASGYVGSANAWGGALGGLGANASNLYLMNQLFGGGGGGGIPGIGNTGAGSLSGLGSPAAGDNSNYYNWKLSPDWKL